MAETNAPNLGDGFQNAVRMNENGIEITAAPDQNIDLITSGAGDLLHNGTPISGGGGAVDSVFGRTGTVVAEATDYSNVPNLALDDSVSEIVFTTGDGSLALNDAAATSITLDGAGNLIINPTLDSIFRGGTLTIVNNTILQGTNRLVIKSSSSGIITMILDESSGMEIVSDIVIVQGLEFGTSSPFALAHGNVASLPNPSVIAADGYIMWASDGRKVGEGPGAGTGVPVYYDGTNWLVFSTDTPVQA